MNDKMRDTIDYFLSIMEKVRNFENAKYKLAADNGYEEFLPGEVDDLYKAIDALMLALWREDVTEVLNWWLYTNTSPRKLIWCDKEYSVENRDDFIDLVLAGGWKIP